MGGVTGRFSPTVFSFAFRFRKTLLFKPEGQFLLRCSTTPLVFSSEVIRRAVRWSEEVRSPLMFTAGKKRGLK